MPYYTECAEEERIQRSHNFAPTCKYTAYYSHWSTKLCLLFQHNSLMLSNKKLVANYREPAEVRNCAGVRAPCSSRLAEPARIHHASIIIGMAVMALPCFWGCVRDLRLCNESCASTVDSTGIVLLPLAARRRTNQHTCHASCRH